MEQRPVTIRPDGLSWRSIDGEVILLDERDMSYLHLNGSAAGLWEAVVEGATPIELASGLVAKFSIDPERAAKDVAAFLADLQGRDLVEL